MLELKPQFELFFDVKELYHDMENYWEYMFGHSSKINAHINISRPHKDRMELPYGEIPLQIILKCSNERINPKTV